ncbi:MAG: hypothetical protein ACUVSS_13445 [Anaerolineae bacterium]
MGSLLVIVTLLNAVPELPTTRAFLLPVPENATVPVPALNVPLLMNGGAAVLFPCMVMVVALALRVPPLLIFNSFLTVMSEDKVTLPPEVLAMLR